jgi:hypothetical protein
MWKVVREWRLGNLETPNVRKLQTSSHAKAKAESEHRFYQSWMNETRESQDAASDWNSRLGELAQEISR